MTRDPFLRFALIVLASLYVLGLATVDRFYGPAWAVAVMVFGVLGATSLTIVIESTPEGENPRRRFRQPKDGTRGFERIQP